MKKLILFILFFSTAVLGFSQSQRLVMFEEFTQASCYYCGLDNLDLMPCWMRIQVSALPSNTKRVGLVMIL